MKKKIQEMFELQKEYDRMVFNAHGLGGYEVIKGDSILAALMDELGELNHEIKSNWCWWKKSQTPMDRQKVLEEFADVVHFVLMLINRNKRIMLDPFIEYKFIEGYMSVTGGSHMPAYTMRTLLDKAFIGDRELGVALHKLAFDLGISDDEVYESYKAKNKVNRERVQNGY